MSERLERLYERRLPRNWRNADALTDYQLKRYLSILFEGGVDPTYEEIKGLLSLIDVDKIPTKYLPHMASSLGFEFPYDLDEQTQRTYIKNAVVSYKMKGTEKALQFMLRELTRFTVETIADSNTKSLTIRLYVDPDRQDITKMVEKVRYIVEEYAPPVNVLDIVNFFRWDEEFDRRRDMLDSSSTDKHIIYAGFTKNEGFFLNKTLLNSTGQVHALTGNAEIPKYEYQRNDNGGIDLIQPLTVTEMSASNGADDESSGNVQATLLEAKEFNVSNEEVVVNRVDQVLTSGQNFRLMDTSVPDISETLTGNVETYSVPTDYAIIDNGNNRQNYQDYSEDKITYIKK